MESKYPLPGDTAAQSGQYMIPLEDDDLDEKIVVATPRQLMWRKFTKHKVGVVSLIFLIVAYLAAIFADFVAPYSPLARTQLLNLPPDTIHIVDSDGNIRRPFVYGLNQSRDMTTLSLVYEPNYDEIHYIHFFVQGEPYTMFGFIESDIHLFGTVSDRTIHLAGTDSLGRDMLSRLIFGARISLSVGMLSVFLTLALGMILGGISGLYGGIVDNIIQRVIETIIAIPSIPLWMGLAAAIPVEWSPVAQYFAILVVLSFIGWTGVARIARGKFLATREQDFVTAANLYGCSQWRIIRRHLIPTFISFVIVRITLDIPRIIIAETALSFLGIGLREPTVSWGVLLQAAQRFQVVSITPWLWIGPAVCIITVVLAFNFVGDAARDAADPFSR
jgi:peptide/nickel transport system permease protein